MFSFLQHIISLAILYLYPSYRSYKALDSKNITDAQEWLCYWIVAGILTVPLLISNSVLNWFPFYYEIKLLFCLWLIFPKTKGHLYLFNKYIIPNMDKFSGRIDTYARDITEMSKKYAGAAWQKGLEIAQTKFFEVLAKGPSALLDFSNISFNFGNLKNSDDGRIREINDDDEDSFNNDDSKDNYDGKSRGIDDFISNSNQMVLKKKRTPSTNSNIKKFSIETNHSNKDNNLNKKRSINMKRMDNDYDINNKRDLQRTSSFKKAGVNNKRSSLNSPYSLRQSYISKYNDDDSDSEGDIYDDENNNNNIKSTKPTKKESNDNLFMNMMSNHRPRPGGMMGINDVYSSESDHSNSNSNSNDGNYYEDEAIEENYNYNKNNVYYGKEPRKRLSRVNQRSLSDNYYDYDYDLTHDDDTITGNDLYNDPDNYSGYQKKKN